MTSDLDIDHENALKENAAMDKLLETSNEDLGYDEHEMPADLLGLRAIQLTEKIFEIIKHDEDEFYWCESCNRYHKGECDEDLEIST